MKKIVVIIPDGVGLKNFVYTSFIKELKKANFEVVLWNFTPFQLKESEVKIINGPKQKSHPYLDSIKNALIYNQLKLNITKSNNTIYKAYLFKSKINSIASLVKYLLKKYFIIFNQGEKGIEKLLKKLEYFERKTHFYNECKTFLYQEKPDIVFCSNQRAMIAIAPITAAKDLNIKTSCFIFSWDNLPKATRVINTDYFFVWSELMKEQLLYYYFNISPENIFITGTPQFENYATPIETQEKNTFYQEFNLDLSKKYICYSGDDVTTSPLDQYYLEDVAKAIEKLNKKGYNLGIIFRRCPVDFSSRFDTVLKKYAHIISVINPKWELIDHSWNKILPLKEDLVLQKNLAQYCEMVINLGSSMVFDFVTQNKPCVFINYNPKHNLNLNWDVDKVYKFIHFQSMPSKKAVAWLHKADDIENTIEKLLKDSSQIVNEAQEWFKIINKQPYQEASKRMVASLNEILLK